MHFLPAPPHSQLNNDFQTSGSFWLHHISLWAAHFSQGRHQIREHTQTGPNFRRKENPEGLASSGHVAIREVSRFGVLARRWTWVDESMKIKEAEVCVYRVQTYGAYLITLPDITRMNSFPASLDGKRLLSDAQTAPGAL